MRATKIEIRTAEPRAGRAMHGEWQAAGQLVATLWLREPGESAAHEIAAQITRLHGEAVVATIEGRHEIPAE